MTWRIRLAEREQRIAKLEREIERLQRIEDLRRVTLVTNETCACQHSSVPAGMRRPLSPTADTPSRTSVAAKCHDRAHAVHQIRLILLDHLVGAGEKRRWHRQAERLGGLEVDH
jgi:hypothetical protein